MRGPYRHHLETRTVTTRGFEVRLFGVVHGHFDVEESLIRTPWGPERLNDGIAMVTGIEELLPILTREDSVEARASLKPLAPSEDQERQQASAIARWPGHPTDSLTQ
jgi:hypothetical protein